MINRRKFLRLGAALPFFTWAFSRSKSSWASTLGQSPQVELPAGQLVEKLAFGSCARQDLPQPIWDAIGAQRPDLFVFIGDNIYADTEDMRVVAMKYQQLAAKPQFRKFRANYPVLATWDDHDFGVNDGGVEYPKKDATKNLMLDFFGEPPNSPRRKRDGVYTSYVFGPAGKQLQLILLDLRWFRSALTMGPDGYYQPKAGPEATMLGSAQWKWFEEQLKMPADLRVIASSTQCLATAHPYEKWSNFPRERERLLRLLDSTDAAKNSVVISGDMHFGELSQEQTPKGQTIYDLTSSGMTHIESGTIFNNPNRMAIFSHDMNFGMLRINWNGPKPVVSLEVLDTKGLRQIQYELKVS